MYLHFYGKTPNFANEIIADYDKKIDKTNHLFGIRILIAK